MYNPLRLGDSYLKDKGYNLRERLNFHAGMVMGAVAPTFITRYGFVPLLTQGTSPEWLEWTMALMLGISTCVHGASFGALFGGYCAERLREKREEGDPNVARRRFI